MASEPQTTRITVGGAPEGFDAHLLSDLVVRQAGPVVHIARDDKRLDEIKNSLRFFAPSLPVFVFPAWDCLPYDRISPNSDVSAARMATLAMLAQGFTKPFLLLTTVNAATQRVPARALMQSSSFVATVGKQIDERALRQFLVRMGFNQAPTVMERGCYAIRGGLIDLFPPGESGRVWLDMFVDVLYIDRRFYPET